MSHGDVKQSVFMLSFYFIFCVKSFQCVKKMSKREFLKYYEFKKTFKER